MKCSKAKHTKTWLVCTRNHTVIPRYPWGTSSGHPYPTLKSLSSLYPRPSIGGFTRPEGRQHTIPGRVAPSTRSPRTQLWSYGALWVWCEYYISIKVQKSREAGRDVKWAAIPHLKISTATLSRLSVLFFPVHYTIYLKIMILLNILFYNWVV